MNLYYISFGLQHIAPACRQLLLLKQEVCGFLFNVIIFPSEKICQPN